jgi:hypothetical protein
MTATLQNQTDCCDPVVSEVKGYDLSPETDNLKRLFRVFPQFLHANDGMA